MEKVRHITTPLTEETARSLSAGDQVTLSGSLYTARDAAHARLCNLILEAKPLPVELEGQTIYYAGPSPAKPGAVIGSIGPTTSGRMDQFTPLLLERAGLRAMIGKGDRSQAVIEAMIRSGAVYFAAIGGAAALLAKCTISCEIVCWEELGTEAIRKMTVNNMPLTVAIDCRGENLYAQGPRRYAHVAR